MGFYFWNISSLAVFSIFFFKIKVRVFPLPTDKIIVLFQKARTEGRKGELQDNIQSLRLELNMDKYKTVDKKYSDCLIEVKVFKRK